MHPFRIWHLPIETASEANSTEHWTKKSKRHRLHDKWILYEYNKSPFELKPNDKIKVKWIRVAVRKLDEGDNLPMAFKYARDFLASKLVPGKTRGQADSDPRITWEYDQVSPKDAQQLLNFKFPRGAIVEIYDLTCEHSHNGL